MSRKAKYETLFFNALKDLFVGVEIEGESGYINLMKIKSNYFTQGVFPALKAEINKALSVFEDPSDFREEMFDKLYTFFQRYFSESGSIYFRHTAVHQNVYEKVYTDDRDVVLFWKTHMLYYVKTDRIFNSMAIEVDEVKFFFDASKMTLKKANEKKETIYAFREIDGNGQLVFDVVYSERGRKTKVDDILKTVKKAGKDLGDETLTQAFRTFEKQSEVDYFINKDAKSFLLEQFDLWMYQYLFKGHNVWTETRLAELQTIKHIATTIIDFIAQFEDELVKIWNKPKFVRNSHYVITLDKLAGSNVLQRVMAHPNFEKQVQEWRDLSMLEDDFRTGRLSEKDQIGAPAYPQYQFLPLDTKHFADLELEILGLFENLDEALDGWLVHSENYQALNTLQSKFRDRIKCIHIDPPYNTETSGFLYENFYRHSSWLTMMENRINVCLNQLTFDGSLLCHIDENELERLHMLFEEQNIPNAGTIVWNKKNPMNAGRGIAKQHEYIIWRSKQNTPIYLRNESIRLIFNAAEEINRLYGIGTYKAQKEFTKLIDTNVNLTGGEKAYRYLDENGLVYQSVSLRAPEKRTDPKFFIPLLHPKTQKPCPVPPNGFSRTPETLQAMLNNGEILFGNDETIQPRQKVLLTKEKRRQISSVIENAYKGKADLDALLLDFPYCHPTSLYETLIGSVTSYDEIVFDFFAGSGTTAHAVMNLNRNDDGNRKYILVEMGEFVDTVILPRIKKVAFSYKWKDGKANGGKGMSHFVKYYDLEQYEETLKYVRYQDGDLLDNPYEKPWESYIFLRDEKMLEAVEVDVENNRMRVHLEQLYADIDLAETISQRRGKWIKRITAETVELEDGEVLSLKNPEWEIIKPLVWW